MFRLIQLNNKDSKENLEVGHSHNFTYDGYCFYFGDIRSSKVGTIQKIKDELVVKTKNSTYIFKEEN